MATSYGEMPQSARGFKLSKISEVDPSLGDDHTWFFYTSGFVRADFFNSKAVDELLNNVKNSNDLDDVVKSRRMDFLVDLQSVFNDFYPDDFCPVKLQIGIGILRKDINILARENVRKLLPFIEDDEGEALALKLIKRLAINEPGKAKKLGTFVQQWKIISDLNWYKFSKNRKKDHLKLKEKEYFLAKKQEIEQEIEIVEQKLLETYEIQVKELSEKREKLENLEIIDNRLAKMKTSIETINNVHAFSRLLLNKDYLGIKTMALTFILEGRFDSFLNPMLEVVSQTIRHHMLFNALCWEDVIFDKTDSLKIFRSISEHEHEGAFVSALHMAIVKKRLDVVHSLCMSFPSLLLQEDYRGDTPLDYTFFGSSGDITDKNDIRNLLVEKMEHFLSQEGKRIKHLEESQSEAPNSVLTESKFTQHPIFDKNCLPIIFSMHDPFHSLGGKLLGGEKNQDFQDFIDKREQLRQHLNISELISHEIFKICQGWEKGLKQLEESQSETPTLDQEESKFTKLYNSLYSLGQEEFISEASLLALGEADKRKNLIMQLVRSINDKLISDYEHATCCSEEAYSELLTEKVCCELLEQEDFSLKHCVIAFEEIEKLREENKKLFISKKVKKVEEITIVEESTFEVDLDDEGWGEENADAEEFEDAENGDELTKLNQFIAGEILRLRFRHF